MKFDHDTGPLTLTFNHCIVNIPYLIPDYFDKYFWNYVKEDIGFYYQNMYINLNLSQKQTVKELYINLLSSMDNKFQHDQKFIFKNVTQDYLDSLFELLILQYLDIFKSRIRRMKPQGNDYYKIQNVDYFDKVFIFATKTIFAFCKKRYDNNIKYLERDWVDYKKKLNREGYEVLAKSRKYSGYTDEFFKNGNKVNSERELLDPSGNILGTIDNKGDFQMYQIENDDN